MKQAPWLEGITAIGHWRTRDGDEVDLVIERDDGAVVAFEVKASQRVDRQELAPLRKLRDATGSSFLAGIALHIGAQPYVADDRIHITPVDALWSPQPEA